MSEQAVRRFEVISKIFGKGIFTLDLEMDWAFDATIIGPTDRINVERHLARAVSGTWRILSVGCPAKWHKDQAEDARCAQLPITNYDPTEDEDEDEPTENTVEQSAEPFETPLGKWLTIVTDIGEVLGFEIVRELS